MQHEINIDQINYQSDVWLMALFHSIDKLV